MKSAFYLQGDELNERKSEENIRCVKSIRNGRITKNREYDILPCPFCGNKAELKKSYWIGVEYSVECTKCNCRTNSSNNYNEVIKSWNTRYYDKEGDK